MRSARDVLATAGFTGPALDTALGVSFAESNGYADAVGDVTLVDDTWGPSIGLFQIRSLREPLAFSVSDRFRYSWALLNPHYNAAAAWAISQGGADWTPWTLFRNGAYEQHVGADYGVRTGHVRADRWNA